MFEKIASLLCTTFRKVNPPDALGSPSTRMDELRQVAVEPEAEVSLGAGIATLLINSQQWQLRRVESHLLMEGAYEAARVSLDCVPQGYSGLFVGDSKDGRLLVPITIMRKGVLRSLDVRDAHGDPAPVVGRSEYGAIMTEALMFELGGAASNSADRPSLELALAGILDDDIVHARAIATDLIENGRHGGQQCVVVQDIPPSARVLIDQMIESYVLLIMIRAADANQRQVLKYSYQSPNPPQSLRLRDQLLIAAGYITNDIKFRLSYPTGAASHHFEVAIPKPLQCELLEMPEVKADRNTLDVTPTGVAHAAARFPFPPDEEARIALRVPLDGLRGHTAWVCALTFVTLVLGLVLPGAQEALLDARDGAAAILLAIPAVLVAFVATEGENVLVTRSLRPLRVIVVACALLLLACAASIVGWLHDPWRGWLWMLGASACGVAALFLTGRELWGAVSGILQVRSRSESQKEAVHAEEV